MSEINIKPNSHKYKTEQKNTEERNIKKVVTGNVKTRQKNGARKFADVFIAEDARNVKSYILMDVLIPAAKKTIADVITNSIDMLLYGGSRHTTKTSGDKVSYRNYYDRSGDRFAREATVRTRFDYDDIVFSTRPEADAVLGQMQEVIERYGFVTVADMYDMADLPQPYTSNRYGWTNIRNTEVVRLREGGYILKLPKASPID